MNGYVNTGTGVGYKYSLSRAVLTPPPQDSRSVCLGNTHSTGFTLLWLSNSTAFFPPLALSLILIKIENERGGGEKTCLGCSPSFFCLFSFYTRYLGYRKYVVEVVLVYYCDPWIVGMRVASIISYGAVHRREALADGG